MDNTEFTRNNGFPDPLLPRDKKVEKTYGLRYAKAIESQWGKMADDNSLFKRRAKVFDDCRKYANGTQDTTIYQQILTSLNVNDGDGSLLNLDWSPVPILPKFVRVAVNKILDKEPYPNLEAVDPLSLSKKDEERRRYKRQVELREDLIELKQMTGGMQLGDIDPEQLPETTEEAEIMLDTTAKLAGEIAAQIGTNLTLEWSNYNDEIFRESVLDLVRYGLTVNKRHNDPNYGIRITSEDPRSFVHGFTEDQNFRDVSYMGMVKRIPISELKRLAGDQFTEDQYKKMAEAAEQQNNTRVSNFNHQHYDNFLGRTVYGYDSVTVSLLDFEFKTVDRIWYEEKKNRHGNTGFYKEGYTYKEKTNSVFERSPHCMDIEMIYHGKYIMGTDYIFDYAPASDVPRNIHNLQKAEFSFSAQAVNLVDMIPKSLVGSCIGFADMVNITHLKWQQAIAKAKPDGLMVDFNSVTGVTLGKAGELQPIDLHDIYEKTGIYYYNGIDDDGSGKRTPLQPLDNSIRNINQLAATYHHYMNMIRDTTGINEVMDGSSPKGDQLVAVREQAMRGANNAIYDVEHASLMLFKKVSTDIVKCLQILPEESVIYKAYENAIGKTNMEILSSFKELPLMNFGVTVQKEMDDVERQYLEQNIQISLSAKELDIEDAIAIRNLKDVNQAERLLIVRRKKRIQRLQEQAQQNSQMQAQVAQVSAEAKTNGEMMIAQANHQAKMQQIELEYTMRNQVAQTEGEYRLKQEEIRAMATLGFKQQEQQFKENLEVFKEEKKDARLDQQTKDQSKLIDQRQGNRAPMEDKPELPENLEDIYTDE